MKKLYIYGALACTFAACRPAVKVTQPLDSGDANFGTYLAIGNSLTAGYADGALYLTGQYNSYPKRLHEQFSLIPVSNGGASGDFYQPYLKTNNGFGGTAGVANPRKVLGYVTSCLGETSLSAVNLPNYSFSSEDSAYYVSPGPNGQINNIGVPGIRVADYPVVGYSSLNQYAHRFYYKTSATPLAELKSRVFNLQPSFFTMWLGSNDVLGYATAGGQGNGDGTATPLFANLYNTADITPTQVFKDNFDSALSAATSKGARGVLINIPDITSIPFFTTVPAQGLYLTRKTQADSLAAYWAAMSLPNNPKFGIGYNYFMVEDHNGVVRQSVPGEYILITTPKDSLTCAGWGSLKPIPKQYVLTTEEVQNVRTATIAFNNYIAAEANRYSLALVDMYSYMGTLSSGLVYNGVKYNATYVSGGAFSLDAVHLTPRGYAIVANKIIESINSYYKSSVPYIDVNNYNGILFP